MTDRAYARHHLRAAGDAFEAVCDENDRLAARVAELEGPALTDEQKQARAELVDRLDHAADILVGGKNPYGSVKQSAGLVFAALVRHIRSDAVPLSGHLLRRADHLATALLSVPTEEPAEEQPWRRLAEGEHADDCDLNCTREGQIPCWVYEITPAPTEEADRG